MPLIENRRGTCYGNANWGDLLTKVNGQTITYDASGNPLSYYNGSSYTFTWKKGRQLATAIKGSTSVSYLYNSDGIRTSKTVNGVKHTYYLMGSTIVYETWGSNYIEYLYDENGQPQSMYYYNGTSRAKYYFIKNLQGDVIQLRSSSNAVIANYSYDAWGKVLSITDANGNAITSSTHIANINPIRYRGYYYDTETGLYYLNSRYYDPNTGRFLNADEYISTGQGILGNNMFAYCGNNPISFVDYSGKRYCAGTSVSDESDYDRFISCDFQKRVGLERLGVIVDITAKLNNLMEKNAQKLLQYKNEHGIIAACFYFYNNVKDGGDLDIKLQDEWTFEKGKIYIYNGRQLRYDDPGNIVFGYVGAVIFPQFILCMGAGLNQISKYNLQFGDIFSFYDDPRDNYMIKYGYRLYQEGL